MSACSTHTKNGCQWDGEVYYSRDPVCLAYAAEHQCPTWRNINTYLIIFWLIFCCLFVGGIVLIIAL